MIPGTPEHLYNQMCRELQRIHEQHLPEEKELEENFGASMRYDQQLTDWVRNFRFDTEAEEIHFFKIIRPSFSRELEYYKRRYQAILFRPTQIAKQIPFFEYEIDKINKFFMDNAGFYQYYKSGQESNDNIYFRRHCEPDAEPDDPCQTETGYDLLLAVMQGLDKYKAYLQKQLDVLKDIKTDS